MTLYANIALIDKTAAGKVGQAELSRVAAALTTQINRDLHRWWPVSATVAAVPATEKLPVGTWPIHIVDALPPGEGGYHWMDGQNQPYAEVEFGQGWTVAASHETCLTGDTAISLLNGTEVAVRDLVGVEEFWVYSCKPDGSIRPGRGHSARLTKKNAPIVEVTLDNGQSIRCTDDHKFMLRDGTYCEARRLDPGTSLMPLYRERDILDPGKKRKGMTTYERVWNPGTSEWIWTHRMVVPYCSEGYVRHHKDFNRFNNAPTNIEVMKWEDHQRVHAEHITHYNRLNKGKPKKFSPEHLAFVAENGPARLREYNGSEKHKADLVAYYAQPGVREKHGAQMSSGLTPEIRAANQDSFLSYARSEKGRSVSSANITIYNKSEEHREVVREVGKKAMALLWSDPEFVARKSAESSERAKKRNADPAFQERARHSRLHVKRGVVHPDCPLCAVSEEVIPAAANNHKVVSVQACGEEDVYDITVDNYHNFATAAGAFVHNCEMVIDPAGNRLMTARSIVLDAGTQEYGLHQYSYLVEVCDPCEAVGYTINGVPVSDFVIPQYYHTGTKDGRYSYTGHIVRPLQIIGGGYLSWYDPSTGNIMQFLWVDPGQPPSIQNLGPATGARSLKEFVDNKTRATKRLSTSSNHPAVDLAGAMASVRK